MIDKYKFFKIIQNPNLIGIWFSILFAGLQFRIITFVLDKNFISSLQAAEGVFNGTPHWRIYQSRFLGPILFEGSKYIFNDGLTSYILLSIFLIAIAGFIVTCYCIMILILKLTFLPIKTPNDGPNFALGPAFAPNPLYQV